MAKDIILNKRQRCNGCITDSPISRERFDSSMALKFNITMNNNGKIENCSDTGCGWICCKFNKGNYIVLFPNELKDVKESVKHLKVIDDNYKGGKKVVCTADNTANCDDGYKPIDCKLYPLWMKEGGYIKGSKCPLPMNIIEDHKVAAQTFIDEYMEKNKEVDAYEFMDKISMVGYEKLK